MSVVVVAELLAHGHTRKGWLGIGIAQGRLPSALAETEGRETALVLTAVEEDGPADKAGLLLGDVLLDVDGESLPGFDDLVVALASRADSKVELRVLRAGVVQDVAAEVGHRPTAQGC